MRKKTFLLTGATLAIIAGVVIGSLAPVQAVNAAGTDTISIDAVSVGCGSQTVTITGTATYSEPTQHLIVTLNGTQLIDDHDEPAIWSTGAQTLAVGTHTVVATIYDKSTHSTVRAQDTKTITISDCASSSHDSSSESSTPGSGETDCCPGPDPVVEAPAKKSGQVKGISTKKASYNHLQPMNSIFREAFGRNPNQAEWTYWANRFLDDVKFWKNGQPQYDVLLGAMQWHHLHGRTIGD